MTSTEERRRRRSRKRRRAPTSRRGFLVLAGVTAGVGLPAGTAGGSESDRRSRQLVVAASPAQRETARDAVARFRESDPSVGVSFRVAETTEGFRRFAAGDADVLAASRPILPAERTRVVENGVAYANREIPTNRMVLHQPESTWCECLSPGRIAEAWSGDGPVETWAEAAPEDAAGSVTFGPEYDSDENGGSRRRAPPTPDGTMLVRGVREFQYASGFGGVGYYESDSEHLASASAASDDAASETPLVRLSFLYVDRDSLEELAAEELIRAYSRRSAERVGRTTYYENPIGG
ncbi:substrate-binding domain-containing protein [Haloprofundus salinisoli]|uniref:substrate-binding domain-containing protein n=1 Tax=Haloprofundus salinisoli TaxID=2876193 RepID=UPI001CCB6AEB|nr:substrate-binding domain-containing protein [Haloprofundus salinisoli]